MTPQYRNLRAIPEYTWAFHDGTEIGPSDARSHCQAHLALNRKTFKPLQTEGVFILPAISGRKW
jgi:hypothetical protein